MDKYNESYCKELSKIECGLLSQIYTNSMMLEHKKQLNNIAFIILNQFIILILILILIASILIFNSNLVITIIIFFVIEIKFILNILNIDFIKKLFYCKCQYQIDPPRQHEIDPPYIFSHSFVSLYL